MKTLESLLKGKLFTIIPVKYRHNGYLVKRRGFDIICDLNHHIFYSFEPYNDSSGNKWKITDHIDELIRYRKSLRAKDLAFMKLDMIGMTTGFVATFPTDKTSINIFNPLS